MASKYLRLTAELRQLCSSLRQQGLTRLPGELTLCENYHCSRQTVRKALEQLASEGLIVRMHGSGTYLSSEHPVKRRNIALVCASLENYRYPQLYRDLEKLFSEHGFSTKAYSTDNHVMRERLVLEQILADPPSGILLEGAKTALPSPNLDLLARIESLKIPLIYLYSAYPGQESVPCIQDDNVGGARQLTRYLLGKGHRNLAAILKSDDRQGLERYEGFINTLCQHNCEVREESIFWFDTAQREALLAGRDEWMYAFIRRRLPGCSAVLCYNDEIAYSLIHCLHSEGLHVPEDIAVAGFDNSHYCTICPISITSLAHERHQMANTAAKAMLDLIRGRKVQSVYLPWSIRERAST